MNGTELDELIESQKDAEYLKESYDKLRKNYENQYVAIKNRNIIAHHKDMKTVLKTIEEKKLNPANVFIEFFHPKDMILVL